RNGGVRDHICPVPFSSRRSWNLLPLLWCLTSFMLGREALHTYIPIPIAVPWVCRIWNTWTYQCKQRSSGRGG
ncbi:hypothetical protein GGR50DRAFT_640911, partial [Xylaria sp. CBS 124048]